ncbi:MAG: HugZ family protein [Candidatus Rokuibacteriota bacterium]
MTNRHAGGTPSGGAASVPEPSYAERARTLVHLGQTGALASVSRRHPGHPFASVMPYALDAGRPLFLISSMAMHTQNLEADPRASLLVTQRTRNDDALAAGRVTLLGQTRRLPQADVGSARAAYLARHDKARFWVDFEDFAFWRLDLTDVYFVGGFAAMDWVSADGYLAAAPDPLAEVAPSIIDHMNQDHADTLPLYARVFAEEAADEATMTSVDRLGFTLRLRTGERLHGVRVAFPREVRTAGEARVVLVEMLRQARG